MLQDQWRSGLTPEQAEAAEMVVDFDAEMTTCPACMTQFKPDVFSCPGCGLRFG